MKRSLVITLSLVLIAALLVIAVPAKAEDLPTTHYAGKTSALIITITNSPADTKINVGGVLETVTWSDLGNNTLQTIIGVSIWIKSGIKVENGVTNPTFDPNAGVKLCDQGGSDGWTCEK